MELKRVNNFEAKEIFIGIGTIKFEDKTTNDLCLNFWYHPDGKEEENPLIIEFSFDYDAKNKENNHSDNMIERNWKNFLFLL